jgi:hypothetical protein
MPIVIKTPADIEGMRLAGRLAAEVLDFVAPHVRAGITTGELDRLCHEYMVGVQGTVPARTWGATKSSTSAARRPARRMPSMSAGVLMTMGMVGGRNLG